VGLLGKLKKRNVWALWGYFIVSLIVTLFLFHFERYREVIYYSIVSLTLAVLSGYLARRFQKKVRSFLIQFYKEAYKELLRNSSLPTVSRPYRRAALYVKDMIDDIVDGKDVYVLYQSFIAVRKMSRSVYEKVKKISQYGMQILAGTLLDMVRVGSVKVDVFDVVDVDDLILYVKYPDAGTPYVEEVCDVLKKAAIHEIAKIQYDKEKYDMALRLSTLKKFLEEVEMLVDVEGRQVPVDRYTYLGSLVYEHLLVESMLPRPYSSSPPIQLPVNISLIYDIYNMMHSGVYFFSTLSWAMLLFGISHFAFLTAVVGFAIAYMYVPGDIYHPSVPWYNRYRVWQVMRDHLKTEFWKVMSIKDAMVYVSALKESEVMLERFIMGVYIYAIEIEV